MGLLTVPTFFRLSLSDTSDDFICSIAIYETDISLCSECNQASDTVATT